MPACPCPVFRSLVALLPLCLPLAAVADSTLVSVDSRGRAVAEDVVGVALSGDGRFVLMHSAAELVPDADDGHVQVYVHDRDTGAIDAVSRSGAGDLGNADSFATDLSADGRWVVFTSAAANLDARDDRPGAGAGPGSALGEDVYLHDRTAGTTTLVSVPATAAEPYAGSDGGRVSDDGRFVVYDRFDSRPGGGAHVYSADVYLHDTDDGSTRLVSERRAGGGRAGNGPSRDPSISDDGGRVAFASRASDLVAGDTNDASDVFVFDVATGAVSRASVDERDRQVDGDSGEPSISGDGTAVAFASLDDGVVPGGGGTFVRDLAAEGTVRADGGGGLNRRPSIDRTGDAVASITRAGASFELAPDAILHRRSSGQTGLPVPAAAGVHAGSVHAVVSADGRHVAVTTAWGHPDDAGDGGALDVVIGSDATGIGPATPVSPSNTSDSVTPEYAWRPAAGASWYLVWAEDVVGTTVKRWYTAEQAGCGDGLCSATPEVAVAGTTTWWVLTWNAAGYGPWSEPASFVADGPPRIPVLTAPSGDGVGSRPVYRWDAVEGATWYRLWVQDASGPRVIAWYTRAQAACDADADCLIRPAETVTGNVTWWVQGWEAGTGNGGWSAPLRFTP